MLESIAFLALCLGVPLAMVVTLIVLLIKKVVDAKQWRANLVEPWQEIEADRLRSVLSGTNIVVDGRARFSHCASGPEGVLLCTYSRTSPGSSRSRRRVLRRLIVVPRSSPGPVGVIQPRQGGMLEAAALAAAGALGAKPQEVEGWEWAIISGPSSEWLDVGLSEPLQHFVRPGERLHLGEGHIVISMMEGSMAELLEDAAARARELRQLL